MAIVKISGLKPSTTYSYAVYAIDESGNKSQTSRTITFTTPDPKTITSNKTINIQLGGGSIFAGSIDFKTKKLIGSGVSFDSNGILGQFPDGTQSFLLEAGTGNAYFAGTVTASAGNIGGFSLKSNSLSATNIVLSSSTGLNLGNGVFSVDQNGNLVATSASITGNINATSGSFTGGIYGASLSGGTLNINNKFIVDNSGNASVSGNIIAQSGSFTGAINAASMYGGYLNINGNASITGYIVANSGSFTAGLYASVGTIGGFNISSSSLSAGTGTNTVGLVPGSYPFFAGNATPSLAKFKVDNSGNASALSLYASSGQIMGDFSVSGQFYAGNKRGSGLSGVQLDSSGLYGYYGNNTAFYLPTDPTQRPIMASFTLLETRFTGSGASAVIIAGDLINNNITISGDKTAGKAAMIFSKVNGVDATATSGSGFYFNDKGEFRIASDNNNYISGSAGNLFVKGAINATSGSFVGGIYGASISGGILNITSNASIGGYINATSGSFTGTISASTGQIAGWSIQANSLSATNIVLSSSTGLNLGPNNFIVDRNGSASAAAFTAIGPFTGSFASINTETSPAAGIISQTFNHPWWSNIPATIQYDGIQQFYLKLSTAASKYNGLAPGQGTGIQMRLNSSGLNGYFYAQATNQSLSMDEFSNSVQLQTGPQGKLILSTGQNSAGTYGRMYLGVDAVGSDTNQKSSIYINTSTNSVDNSNNGIYIDPNGWTRIMANILPLRLNLTNYGTNGRVYLEIDANGNNKVFDIEGLNNTASNNIVLNSTGSITLNSTANATYLNDTVYVAGSTYLNGNVRITNSTSDTVTSAGIYGYGGGTPTTPVVINNTTYRIGSTVSSIRFKYDISNMDDVLDTVLKLTPVKFKWKIDKEEYGEENVKYDIGFIAEEARDLGLEQLFILDNTGEPRTFQYHKLPIYNLALIQRQEQKIKELEARIAALENK